MDAAVGRTDGGGRGRRVWHPPQRHGDRGGRLPGAHRAGGGGGPAARGSGRSAARPGDGGRGRSGGGRRPGVGRWGDGGGRGRHPAGDPSRALSIVRDMVESKGVTVFMGNMWVLSASGARAYLEDKKIPVVGGDVASALWFKSPMFFPQGSSFDTLAVGSLKTMADLG